MKIVEIIRLEETPEFGTFGVMLVNKEIFCMTLEPPDRENKQNVSSIPAKPYKCEKFYSPTFGHTYQIVNVPERSFVLFHAGNVKEHTQGCIVLGEKIGKLRIEGAEKRAVKNSGATFRKFMELMGHDQIIKLTITERYGP